MVRNFHGFTEGNWYIYTGTKREAEWNSEGKMDFALEHFPVKCMKGIEYEAVFEDQTGNVYGRPWYWKDGFDNWIEIKDPNEEYRIEQGEFLYNSNSDIVLEGMIGQYASGNPNYVLTRPPFENCVTNKASTPSCGYKSKFQDMPQLYATVTETRFDTSERIVSLGELTGKAILKSNMFVNKKRKFKKL
jgi:hypothetical protein